MKKLLVLGSLFLIHPLLLAEETGLSWSQCLKEATQNNPDLLSARKSLNAAENSHLASLGQFFPQISLNASAGRSGPGGLDDALSNPVHSGSANLSLSASESLFSGFRDFASVDSSNAQLDIARAQLTQAKAQLSRDLKVAFYTLLYSQQQIELLQAIADRNKANQDLVEMNYKGGTDNKGSLLQAQATYQESLYEVDQAKRSLSLAQRQLALLLGRDPPGSIQVAGDFQVPSLQPVIPDFKQLTLLTPAYLQSLAQLHLSESSYVSARGTFFPTLSANASLYRQGDGLDDLNTPGWSAGLSLNFPLFTGGKDLFNFMSAEESKGAAQENLRSTLLKTSASLESAFSSYQNAVENTQVQSSFLSAAKTREEIAKAEYLNGLLSFQNWDQLETNLTSQQKSQLSSSLTAKTTEAAWELAQGKGEIQ